MKKKIQVLIGAVIGSILSGIIITYFDIPQIKSQESVQASFTVEQVVEMCKQAKKDGFID